MHATRHEEEGILEALIGGKADILHHVNSRKLTADLIALEQRKVASLNVLLRSGAQLDLGELMMLGARGSGSVTGG